MHANKKASQTNLTDWCRLVWQISTANFCGKLAFICDLYQQTVADGRDLYVNWCHWTNFAQTSEIALECARTTKPGPNCITLQHPEVASHCHIPDVLASHQF